MSWGDMQDLDRALYSQCELRRGDERRVRWMPTAMAVPGKYVKLLEGDIWSRGWVIVEVHQTLEGWQIADDTAVFRVHTCMPGRAVFAA